MNYDKIYQESNKTFGYKASPIVINAQSFVKLEHKTALDIGSGQGRDSVYLAGKNFNVTAIEKSEIGANQLRELNISNINVINRDILNYDFSDNKFDLIISINVLHFLTKDEALNIIENIKQSLTKSGIVAITLLMDNGKFQPDDLKNAFDGFEIIKYFENTKHDNGHPGQPEPHDHKIAGIIAKKI